MSTSPQDFNARIIDEFRASGGHAAAFGDSTLLLLHHTGARTGTSRVNPLVYLPDDGRYVIFASKAGAPNNPDWYHNLMAHPDVQIEVGTDTLDVTARQATGEERDRLYGVLAERSPQFAEYERKTDRVIPVIVLTPVA
jgi:deazaflavin-dependent oxidoreductase (nitroreductase family)